MQRQNERMKTSASMLIFREAKSTTDKSKQLLDFQKAAAVLSNFVKLTTFEEQEAFRKKHASTLSIPELNSTQREAFDLFCKRMQDKNLIDRIDSQNIFQKKQTQEAEKRQMLVDTVASVPLPGANFVAAGIGKIGDHYADYKEGREKEGTDKALNATNGIHQTHYSSVIRLTALALVEQLNDLLVLFERDQLKSFIHFLVDHCIPKAKVKGVWSHIDNPKILAEAILTSFYAVKEQSTSITVGSTTMTVGESHHVKLGLVDANTKSLLSNQFIRINGQLYGKAIDSKFILAKNVSAQTYLYLVASAREATEAEKLAIEASLASQKSLLQISHKASKHRESYVEISKEKIIEALAFRQAPQDKSFFEKIAAKNMQDKAKIIHGLLSEFEKTKNDIVGKKCIAENNIENMKREQLVSKFEKINQQMSELTTYYHPSDEKHTSPRDEKSRAVDESSIPCDSPTALFELFNSLKSIITDPKKLFEYNGESLSSLNNECNALNRAYLVTMLDVAPATALKDIPEENKRSMHDAVYHEINHQLSMMHDQLDSLKHQFILQENQIKDEINRTLGLDAYQKLIDIALWNAPSPELNSTEMTYLSFIKESISQSEKMRELSTLMEKTTRNFHLSSIRSTSTSSNVDNALRRLKTIREESRIIKDGLSHIKLGTLQTDQQKLQRDNLKETLAPAIEVADIMLLSSSDQEIQLINHLRQLYNEDTVINMTQAVETSLKEGKALNYDQLSVEQRKDLDSLYKINSFKRQINKHKRDLNKHFSALLHGDIVDTDSMKQDINDIRKRMDSDMHEYHKSNITVSAAKPTGFIHWLKRCFGFAKAQPRKPIQLAAIAVATVLTGTLAAKVATAHFVALGLYKIGMGTYAKIAGALAAGSGAGAVSATVSTDAVKHMITASQSRKTDATKVEPVTPTAASLPAKEESVGVEPSGPMLRKQPALGHR